MSDDEDFDEFPSIEVNSSITESSSFLMPSAEAVAGARAREAAAEAALRRLREEHAHYEKEVCMLGQSDSSGSEGEAALAAAVAGLRVLPPRARASPAPPALQAALAAALPPEAAPFLTAYMEATSGKDAAAVQALTDELLDDVSEMLYCSASEGAVAWADDELLGVAAWLCALGAGEGARAGSAARARRALHLLVDDVAEERQVALLQAVLATALAEDGGAAPALLGALEGGGARRGGLARALHVQALHALAGLPAQTLSLADATGALVGGAWRRLAPARRLLALQLLARLAAGGAGAGEGAEARRTLQALAQASRGSKAPTADMLKVLVAATKLNLLFQGRE